MSTEAFRSGIIAKGFLKACRHRRAEVRLHVVFTGFVVALVMTVMVAFLKIGTMVAMIAVGATIMDSGLAWLRNPVLWTAGVTHVHTLRRNLTTMIVRAELHA